MILALFYLTVSPFSKLFISIICMEVIKQTGFILLTKNQGYISSIGLASSIIELFEECGRIRIDCWNFRQHVVRGVFSIQICQVCVRLCSIMFASRIVYTTIFKQSRNIKARYEINTNVTYRCEALQSNTAIKLRCKSSKLKINCYRLGNISSDVNRYITY